jgi:beta-phosphoglucomutase-like phosphatase (HAD superfamily)
MTSSFALKSSSHGQFFSLFDAIVLGDDPTVKKGKPHPDIFIEAAKRISSEYITDFSDTLAFEDSPTGVTVKLSILDTRSSFFSPIT